MTLFTFIYYLGLVACGIQGAEKARSIPYIFSSPASFLAALGGGMSRDLLFLHVFPVAFTAGCIPDVMIALLSGTIYSVLTRKQEPPAIVMRLVSMADALGLGTFIAYGVDKALFLGTDPLTVFCCGIVTALGGGILSSLLCGKPSYVIIFSGNGYRLITLLGTMFYMACLYRNQFDLNSAHYLLITYTFLTVTSYSLFDDILSNGYLHSLVSTCHILMIVTDMTVPAFYWQYSHHTSNVSYSKSLCCRLSCNLENGMYCAKQNAALLSYKFCCPRRFSRGR